MLLDRFAAVFFPSATAGNIISTEEQPYRTGVRSLLSGKVQRRIARLHPANTISVPGVVNVWEDGVRWSSAASGESSQEAAAAPVGVGDNCSQSRSYGENWREK